VPRLPLRWGCLGRSPTSGGVGTDTMSLYISTLLVRETSHERQQYYLYNFSQPRSPPIFPPSYLVRAAVTMALPLPSSPAGWPFAILAGISLPMHAHQLIRPQHAMKQYEVNSVVARLLGIMSLP
jgi:hypothetical protein